MVFEGTAWVGATVGSGGISTGEDPERAAPSPAGRSRGMTCAASGPPCPSCDAEAPRSSNLSTADSTSSTGVAPAVICSRVLPSGQKRTTAIFSSWQVNTTRSGAGAVAPRTSSRTRADSSSARARERLEQATLSSVAEATPQRMQSNPSDAQAPQERPTPRRFRQIRVISSRFRQEPATFFSHPPIVTRGSGDSMVLQSQRHQAWLLPIRCFL